MFLILNQLLLYAAGNQHEFYQNGSLKHILDENLWSSGNTYATGTKNFLISHPDNSGRMLRYSAQESPEVILRHRGRGKTGDDCHCKIIPPEHFRLVTESGGDVTVNLTPIENNSVYLDGEPSNAAVYVSSTKPNVNFHYEIIAIRSGYLNYPVELDNNDNNINDDDKTLINRLPTFLSGSEKPT